MASERASPGGPRTIPSLARVPSRAARNQAPPGSAGEARSAPLVHTGRPARSSSSAPDHHPPPGRRREETIAAIAALRAEERAGDLRIGDPRAQRDRKSTRLNSSHLVISYAVFCLKK